MIDLIILGVLIFVGSRVLVERRRTRATSNGFNWPRCALLRQATTPAPSVVGEADAAAAPAEAGEGWEGRPADPRPVIWSASAEPMDAEVTALPPATASPVPSAPRLAAFGTLKASIGELAAALPRPALSRVAFPAVSWERLPLGRLRPGVAGVALTLAVVFVLIGQRALVGGEVSASTVQLYVLGLLGFAALDALTRRGPLAVDPSAGGPPSQPIPQADAAAAPTPDASTEALPLSGPVQATKAGRSKPRPLLIAAVGFGVVGWVLMRGKGADADVSGVVLAWLLSLGAALGAALRQEGGRSPERVHLRADWRAWGALGGIVILAVLFRVLALEAFPYAFGGDEGSQAMAAVDVLSGKLKNPFATGWYDLPTLFFFVEAGAIAVFGDSVAGVRMAAALLGVAAVVFTFLLARRLFGTVAGVVAGLLLAAFHYNVHFSRLASIQIMDSLAIVALLYFLDRTLVHRRPVDALLAGITIGLTQYSSFAGRIVPLIAITYIVLYLLVGRLTGARPDAPATPRFTVALPAWIVLGAVLTFAPLWAYFVDHPREFSSRIDQVSMFASGWLEREMRSTGRGAVDLVVNQVWRGILLPFYTGPGGWYINHRPFIGAPMAVVLALGLAVVTLGFWRRQFLGLAIAYWACAVGLGLTEDPTQTQRFVVASSLMAVLGAIAITAGVRIARELAQVPAVVAGTAASVIVVGLLAWNALHYFGPRESRLYGDGNTMAATELAYFGRGLPPGSTVYFLGAPRMLYYGFSTLPFIARQVKGVDINSPLTQGATPPPISGPTVFAALPERAGELRVVQEWFPNGQLRELRRGQEHFLTVYELPR